MRLLVMRACAAVFDTAWCHAARSSAAAVAIACLSLLAPSVADAVGTAPDLRPWLARYCGECHADGAAEGGFSLAGVGDVAASADDWERIHEKLQLSLMPPPESLQPPATERAAVITSMADALRQSGRHVEDKLALPNYGNYVPHEPLFRGEAHPAPATAARAWRVRPEVYAARAAGGIQPFALLPRQQVADFGSLYVVDESAAEIVLRNAQSIVDRWTKAERKDGALVPAPGAHPPLVALLEPAGDPPAGKIDEAIGFACQPALGRGPTPEELQHLRAVYAAVLAEHDRPRALRAVLTAAFLLPDAYYRVELGSGSPDEHGRRRLGKPELLAAIQQTLFGAARPRRLSQVLADPTVFLDTRESVAALVSELLDGEPPEHGSNARVLGFFDEYFDYRKAKDVFKETGIPLSSTYDANRLVDDAAQFVEYVVREDRDVFRRLLTGREGFVVNIDKHGRHASDHTIFNLPPDFKYRDGPVPLDPEARCGMLTQPAWLVAHSGNFDNDPVRRGKWILEHLLGGTVPDVPVTVCAVVPEDPTKTLRQRFEKIRNDGYCWTCHRQMNQLGMPFEAYDHYGRHRLQELGKPVDTAGAVVASGDPSLDGPVPDAVTLIERLAASRRAEEVFVRYAFRYFLGRNETLRDARTLREAQAAYAEAGGSMKALVAALLSSDSFLYRTEAP
jgi:hypothetical protein